jgi:hypothetical protein
MTALLAIFLLYWGLVSRAAGWAGLLLYYAPIYMGA